jgi:hypothetical protein
MSEAPTSHIPTRRLNGAWHRPGANGWQEITDPLMVTILNAWPDAVVTLRRNE